MAGKPNAGHYVTDTGEQHTHCEPRQYPGRKPVVAAAEPRGLGAPTQNLRNEIREERPVHNAHHRVHYALTAR
jgi:hypothetical protein